MIARAISSAILTLSMAGTASAETMTTKPAVYTMSATVRSASSGVNCPYGEGEKFKDMAGYTGFPGLEAGGGHTSLRFDWVLVISPADAALGKFAYTLKKSSATSGNTLVFNGKAMYGKPASEFTGENGSYKLSLNPSTLASSLTITDNKCIITYSLTFNKSIPAKFLNLL